MQSGFQMGTITYFWRANMQSRSSRPATLIEASLCPCIDFSLASNAREVMQLFLNRLHLESIASCTALEVNTH